MTDKKNTFAFLNGLIMFLIGIGGLIYFLYRLRTFPETFSSSAKILILAAILYAMGRGVFLLKKKQ